MSLREGILRIFAVALLIAFGASTSEGELLDRIVAVVDDDIILWSELQQILQLEMLQRGMELQGNEDKIKEMERTILESMIDDMVLLAKAKEDSIVIEEKQVEDALREQLDLIKGQMSDEEYRRELEEQGLTERDLRDRIRRQIRNFLLKQEEMNLLSRGISVSYKEVQEFRETYADSLPPSISISHIMISPGRERARQKIDDILRRIKAGGDFAELAKRYSDDPGSAEDGGDLGFFERGAMLPEFESAVFAMEPGEISDVIETRLGYHIIKLEEKIGQRVRARHILSMAQPTREDEEAAVGLLRELRERALAGEDFGDLAKQFSQDYQFADEKGFLGLFPREEPPPALKNAVEGMKLGEISLPFETAHGFHIVKLNDDRDFIEALIRQRKIRETFDRMIAKEKERIYIDVRLED